MVIRRKHICPEDIYKQAISRKSYLTQKAVLPGDLRGEISS